MLLWALFAVGGGLPVVRLRPAPSAGRVHGDDYPVRVRHPLRGSLPPRPAPRAHQQYSRFIHAHC